MQCRDEQQAIGPVHLLRERNQLVDGLHSIFVISHGAADAGDVEKRAEVLRRLWDLAERDI